MEIKDSGARREFETGAVRDIQEGKGRCDLLPLDVVALWMNKEENGDPIMMAIASFVEYGKIEFLERALSLFQEKMSWDQPTLILEVSKHFEDGCKKYGENNWQKGIPVKCYVDSGVRHYLKWLRGDDDEPHHRAFCWNMLCAIWTCNHKPELHDYLYYGK